MLRRALIAVALVAAALPVAGAADTRDAGLPLGSPDLRETRDVRILAPGVTQTRIVRGTRSKADYFTVDVAFVPSREEARTLAKRLRADGYRARVDTITARAPDDPEAGPLGYLVRVGQLATEA
jgi:SPOR domain